MKELPDEKTLLELLALAKDAERKARKLNELSIAFEEKWKRKLEGKQAAKQQASEIS
ncbi:hypothetical protein [Argonema antarcticum]|uniref:hypothetical protein n=1 Tax=Argonema antarcticum TaxID=2942763 RepID=UPI00201310B2|nr:hypothetical protein [Argonema antarcticum]MCL1473103.1 hypothetical protein [Argonema antarcticum A004/B2]